MTIKTNRLKYLIFIFASATLVWFWRNPTESETLIKERTIYPKLEDISHPISGSVFSISQSKTRSGIHTIMLNNNQGFSIYGVTSNRDYANYRFFEFIQEGDSLYISQLILIRYMCIEMVKNIILFMGKA